VSAFFFFKVTLCKMYIYINVSLVRLKTRKYRNTSSYLLHPSGTYTHTHTLKKPQMPPPVLLCSGPRGSSCSSGNVMADAAPKPPLMAGCCTMGFDTPERHRSAFVILTSVHAPREEESGSHPAWRWGRRTSASTASAASDRRDPA